MAGTPVHDVARAILERRSWRVFLAESLPDDGPRRVVTDVVGRSLSVFGKSAARPVFITAPDEVSDMAQVVTGRLVGKTNLWLRSAPPSAFAVLVGDVDRGHRAAGRHFYNADAAVAGELIALSAASQGLGSCWMAAIDSTGVARHLDLRPEERIPAVIALGKPGLRRKGALLAAGWDRVTRAAISGRRKALESIFFSERFYHPVPAGQVDLHDVPDDGRDLSDVVAALEPCATFDGSCPKEEHLALIAEAMRLAPSADNAQTWRFVLVQRREQIHQTLEAAKLDIPGNAIPGALIVLFAAPFLIKGLNREQPFALLDHPIAITHGVLMAQTLELRWNVAFDFDHRAVAKKIGAPKDHDPTALIFLDRGGKRGKLHKAKWVQLYRG